MTGTARLSAGEVVEEFLSHYRLPLLLMFISAVSTAAAIVILIKSTAAGEPVRITEASEAAISGTQNPLAVDVAGAVIRPGVYDLPPGARIDDAIVRAGGLADFADLEYLARSVNRALKVTDGMKIYIPGRDEKPSTASKQVLNASDEAAVSNPAAAVSVNSASQAELEALNGIGEKTAVKIIANRPYSSLAELVEKKVLTKNLLDKLSGQLGL